jgi:hypothetical protein
VTSAVPARVPGPGRVAAGLAAGSAVVHLLQVDGAPLGSLVTAAMALACLPCAWHLWRAPTPAVWGLTAAADAGMLLLHATLAAGGGLHGMHGRGGPLMWLGTALVAVQLALAGVAALRRQPAMSQRLPATPRPASGR